MRATIIIILLMQNPEISITELARKVGGVVALHDLIHTYIHTIYLDRLNKAGHLKMHPDGKRSFVAAEGETLARLLRRYRGGTFLDRLVDGFVSMWEAQSGK